MIITRNQPLPAPRPVIGSSFPPTFLLNFNQSNWVPSFSPQLPRSMSTLVRVFHYNLYFCPQGHYHNLKCFLYDSFFNTWCPQCTVNAMKAGSLSVFFKECLAVSFFDTQENVLNGRRKQERKGGRKEKTEDKKRRKEVTH